MKPSPHPSFMPLLKTPPACHAGPAAHLLREHLPRDARLKYEQNARECGSIAHARATALRLGSLFWQKRFYDRPQFVCYEWLRHRLSIPDRGVLLGALSLGKPPASGLRPLELLPHPTLIHNPCYTPKRPAPTAQSISVTNRTTTTTITRIPSTSSTFLPYRRLGRLGPTC